MCSCLKLNIPGCDSELVPGCKVKLGRFETKLWVVNHGWYTWGGNRPFCGWYLTNVENPEEVKPLQLPDLDDIYLIEM